jgi:cellulose synthase (UDP-forming)
MGFYGHSSSPFIIGSHTTYRTAAVREIGGFQPTRAEDHLDTVMLAAHGYRGVYVPEIIAEGEGPENFGIYLQQQFAWAYSMMQIFLTRMPKLLFRHTLRQSLEFFFAQSWYLLWGLSIAVLWLLPAIALLGNTSIVEVPLSEFLAYYLAVLATTLLMWWWSREWFQPRGLLLSWRGCVLELARWPIVLWALINVVFRVSRPYMITRKGHSMSEDLAPASRLYGPYLTLAAVSLGAIIVWNVFLGPTDSQGYLALVLLNLAFLLLMLPTVVGLELRDLHLELGTIGAALRARIHVVVLVAVLAAVAVLTAANVWSPMMEAIG